MAEATDLNPVKCRFESYLEYQKHAAVAQWQRRPSQKRFSVSSSLTCGTKFASVAQWIRASDYESEGRGFESLPKLHYLNNLGENPS
jgi:hypothetical protein